MADCCLHCRHWQFSEIGKDGKRVLGWLTKNGFAACEYEPSWRGISGRMPCENGKFDALPPEDVAKRVKFLEKTYGQA